MLYTKNDKLPPGALTSPETKTFAPSRAIEPMAGVVREIPRGTVMLPSGLRTRSPAKPPLPKISGVSTTELTRSARKGNATPAESTANGSAASCRFSFSKITDGGVGEMRGSAGAPAINCCTSKDKSKVPPIAGVVVCRGPLTAAARKKPSSAMEDPASDKFPAFAPERYPSSKCSPSIHGTR